MLRAVLDGSFMWIIEDGRIVDVQIVSSLQMDVHIVGRL